MAFLWVQAPLPRPDPTRTRRSPPRPVCATAEAAPQSTQTQSKVQWSESAVWLLHSAPGLHEDLRADWLTDWLLPPQRSITAALTLKRRGKTTTNFQQSCLPKLDSWTRSTDRSAWLLQLQLQLGKPSSRTRGRRFWQVRKVFVVLLFWPRFQTCSLNGLLSNRLVCLCRCYRQPRMQAEDVALWNACRSVCVYEKFDAYLCFLQ